MNMTILTQDGEFVNYNHVTKISFFSGEAEIATNENTKEKNIVNAIQIIAKTTYTDTEENSNDVILGVYDESQFNKILESMKKWLNEKNDYHHLFVMPQEFSE